MTDMDSATRSHKMTSEEFRFYVERIKRESMEFRERFWRVIEAFDCFRCSKPVTDCRGRAFVKSATLTRSVHAGPQWQLTYFDDDDATGHIGITFTDEATREIHSLLRQGYMPDNEFQDVLKWESA